MLYLEGIAIQNLEIGEGWGCYVVSNKLCHVQNRNCDPRFDLVAGLKPRDHTDRAARVFFNATVTQLCLSAI